MKRWNIRTHGAIGLILAAFILLGLAYSVVNPLHEATDELRHYRFVRYLVVNRALPVQGEEPCRSQSHHPPLFYGLGALLTGWIDTGRDVCDTPPENPFWQYRYWEVGKDNKNQYLHDAGASFPWRGEALAAHLLRALNVLFGAVAVWFTWATGRRIWPDRPGLAAGGAAFVAFNPMFLYLSGAINNDVVAAATGAGVTYMLVQVVQNERGLTRRDAAVTGVAYGLALLSKTSLAGFALPIVATATYVAVRRRQWREWVEFGLISAGVALLISGWWFARNMMVYGDPTGFQRVTELWGVRNPRESLPLVLTELPYAWSSLWGRFGFGQIPLPQWFYVATRWLVALGLLGWPLSALIWRRRALKNHHPAALLLLLLLTVTSFAVWFNYMLVSPAGPMGRFFFPGLPALGLLLAAGYAQMGGPRHRLDGTVALLLNGVLAAAAVWALVGYLGPAYERPPSWEEADLPVQRFNASFDGLATLRGYTIEPSRVQAGEPVQVALYWEVTAQPPGNFLLFVHLTDEQGTVVAQRDTHPGLGNFPTSQWRPGDRFVETIEVYVPATAYAPAVLEVSVGMYAKEGYRLGIRDGAGQFLGDALRLGSVALEAPAGSLPNPQHENFGDRLELLGYTYETRSISPGDRLAMSFTYRAESDVSGLVLRLELVDPGGNLRARAFGTLSGEPTGEHQQEVVLDVPEDVSPGTYQMRLAIVDDAGGGLLSRLGDDGREVGQDLLLAPLRVPE